MDINMNILYFFTKREKTSNDFFKNLQILKKDQRFKLKGMEKPARGKKKISVNGKIPLDKSR